MPGKPDKQHRIRVKTLDGKPRDRSSVNKLKANQLGMPHIDVVDTNLAHEFIICAAKASHIEQLRSKLLAAGLQAIDGGDTTITGNPTPRIVPNQAQQRAAQHQPPHRHKGQGQVGAHNQVNDVQPLPGKPYGFVPLPEEMQTAEPVWHDGTSSTNRFSGEVRFELVALTPLLVGWERGVLGDDENSDWPIQSKPYQNDRKIINLNGSWSEPVTARKSVICPLRAPWGARPAIIPGDSLKGLLRHELGALLGTPMERVAERSYSYRPNAMYPRRLEGRYLVPRLARVVKDGVETKSFGDDLRARVPTKLELFPENLQYDKKAENFDYRFDDPDGDGYKGGQGAGQQLNSKPKVHKSLKVLKQVNTETEKVPPCVQDRYLETVNHLVDPFDGHFSARHPDVPKTLTTDKARERILRAAEHEVFQPGDLVWVEWDTDRKCIVSLGWHYYYRWAYTDSVRKTGRKLKRHGLFPLSKELEKIDGAPGELSLVRRLLGYTGDNEGSAGIGDGDHTQLMGRLFPNAAVEVVETQDTDESRFMERTFLKELGMPRPSAVEYYIKQPHHPKPRPSDSATLVTYGDAIGYDTPGELAGRKFYLDRADAYTGEPWKDDTYANRMNERSTLALEASKPGRKFRFSIRFRDLEPCEVAAVLVALSPDQFKSVLQGNHHDGYCSKLGYARPLGWGSVRIEAKSLLWLTENLELPTLTPEASLIEWVRTNFAETATQVEWLAIHRRNHPNAADYPRPDGQIHTFHAKLRAGHSRSRRYRR
jgi:CRISPR-associated protein (TIGR03986 family)